jgi:branched-chain amino acid transport system substrate-binding protein
MNIYSRKQAILLTVLALASIPHAHAQKTPGVTENQVLIGSCSALDGPARFLGLQTIVGATSYLNHINSEGGVFGRKLQLLAFDDGYEPANAENCFKRLQKEGIFSAGFFVGTPTAAK